MSIWTEWDPLEAVIVGDTYTEGAMDWAVNPEVRGLLNRILRETKEDLDNLARFLALRGIKVYRPTVPNIQGPVRMPGFNIAFPTAPLVPRDQYLAYGNLLLQTYTSLPDRFLDGASFYPVFQELFKQGMHWISQPPPPLSDMNANVAWWDNGQKTYHETHRDQLLWHTATMFKCGDALISNVMGPGTALGLEWMRRCLPDTRIISADAEVSGSWGHIDHGFFMTDDNTVFCVGPQWLPKCLHNKNVIEIGDLVNFQFSSPAFVSLCDELLEADSRYSEQWIKTYTEQWRGYVQEVSFDTNVLVLDPRNIVFSSDEPALFDFLEGLGIHCHICPIRHYLFWEGGVHCLTLDVKRAGQRRAII